LSAARSVRCSSARLFVSLGLALAGLTVAWRLYNVPSPTEHTAKLGGIKDVLYNNYYLDELQVWLAYRTEGYRRWR